MSEPHDSPLSTGRVLVVGDGDRAVDIVSSLTEAGVDAVPVDSAPDALATLDAVEIDMVVVDEFAGRPADLFGAAARKGHLLPGVVVGTASADLPPGVEQVPTSAEAAAAAVRQRLLTQAAAAGDSAVQRDPLAAFGSTISHELRNHLGAARLAVESLEGETTDQALAALDRLESLASEAEAIGSRRVEEVESVSVQDAAETAAERLHLSGTSIDIDATGSVQADPALVTLMLENLFRNAEEHGGEDVTISVLDTTDGFAVVDDGPGFNTADPFAWGYTSGEGQGAGLALVKRIADTHGWSVEASNDDGARVDVRT